MVGQPVEIWVGNNAREMRRSHYVDETNMLEFLGLSVGHVAWDTVCQYAPSLKLIPPLAAILVSADLPRMA